MLEKIVYNAKLTNLNYKLKQVVVPDRDKIDEACETEIKSNV